MQQKSGLVFVVLFTLFVTTLTVAGLWNVMPRVWLGLSALRWTETTGVITSVELEEWKQPQQKKQWFEIKVRYEYTAKRPKARRDANWAVGGTLPASNCTQDRQ
jgi:hypothetical protein